MVLSCPTCTVPFIVPPLVAFPSATNPTSASLHYLFTRNDAPLDSEMSSIRQLVSDGAHTLGVLDGQIRELENLLAQVVRKREEVVEQVRQYQAIISPVRRIPQELICEVFGWVALSDNDAEEDAKELTAPPWYLGQICRAWRASALSCPPLWTSLTIPRSPPSPRDRLSIETQILRSAHASLKVHWAASTNGDIPDPLVLELILAQCHRWKTLSLNLRGKRVELNWLRPLDGRLLSLKRLVVLNLPSECVMPNIFALAPSLYRVVLIDWDYGHSSPDIALPWGQITHYRGAYTTREQLAILRAAPKLVECALSCESLLFNPAPGAPATLPHLRRLWMYDLHSLPHLTTPLLEDLFCLDSSPRGTSVVLP
ncbi:hypothetical protein DFH06DRAFT_1253834, partial [Mycena polygramma]